MTEKEYIEREAALKTIDKFLGYFYYDMIWRIKLALRKDIPAADVAPVRHGHWIINSDGYYPQCSECMSEPRGREMTKYCSECGALMDGDKYD